VDRVRKWPWVIAVIEARYAKSSGSNSRGATLRTAMHSPANAATARITSQRPGPASRPAPSATAEAACPAVARPELKELADTIDGLLARLEASFNGQRQFIANAAHELRTPLARQRVISQVALADPHASIRSLRAAHERVLASGAQQHQLIDALLTLARGQAGPDKHEPFDLAAVTSKVLAAHQPEAQRRNLALHAALGPAPAAGSPRLAEQLAANLIDNALRHNRSGGRVEVTTGTRDSCGILAVANTGPAVPATAIERLFQPFQRLGTDRTSHGDGLGLGLSIVQAIAETHGASITARPQPEGGLFVEVSFPPLACLTGCVSDVA
jgi:signal transduction histidine kinase